MKGKKKQAVAIDRRLIILAYVIIGLGILGSTSSALLFVVGDYSITKSGSMLQEAIEIMEGLEPDLIDLKTQLTEVNARLEIAVSELNDTVIAINTTVESLSEFFNSSVSAFNRTSELLVTMAGNNWLQLFANETAVAANETALLIREVAENLSVTTAMIETTYDNVYELTEDVESTVDSLTQSIHTISIRVGSLEDALSKILPYLRTTRELTSFSPLGMLRLGLYSVVVYLLGIHVALILIGVLLWRILSSLQKPI